MFVFLKTKTMLIFSLFVEEHRATTKTMTDKITVNPDNGEGNENDFFRTLQWASFYRTRIIIINVICIGFVFAGSTNADIRVDAVPWRGPDE